jgi:HK97 family phage prohead protease
MPYGISQNQSDCDSWATVKFYNDTAETITCHESKADAIAQMVALSASEDIEPLGDVSNRAKPDELTVGDYVSWNSSGGKARGEIKEIERDGTISVPDTDFDIKGTPDNPAALIQIYQKKDDGYVSTETLVGHKFSTLTKIDELEEPSDDDMEERAIDLTPPTYMQRAAKRGLEMYGEGHGGDGLVPATISSARKMANGQVSIEKWRKIGPWIARHLVDLDAPKNKNADDPEYPGAGLVAHLLWGSGPSKENAQRAMNYAIRLVDRFDEEADRALPVTSADTGETRMEELVTELEVVEEVTNLTPVEWVTKTIDDKRSVAFSNLEVRAIGEGNTLVGYAALWDTPSLDMGFTEYVTRGAFTKTLKDGADVRLLFDHEGAPLARTKSGTMRLFEDERGLRVEADLDPANPLAQSVMSALRRGDLNQMSFAFRTIKDSWSKDRSVRELREVQLFDVSVVTYPAYEETVAELRAMQYNPRIVPTRLRRQQVALSRIK